MGKVEIVRIEYSKKEALVFFKACPEASKFIWEDRILRIQCSAGVPQDPVRICSLFHLALAPLVWIGTITIVSPYPITTAAKACIDIVGMYVCRHYRWKMAHWTEHLRAVPPQSPPGSDVALFFSGGVDSLSALLRERHSIARLVHLSNFDYVDKCSPPHTGKAALRHAMLAGRTMQLPVVSVITNIANIIRHSKLDCYFPTGCSFWYGLQHVNHLAVAMGVLDPPPLVTLAAGSFDKLHDLVGSCAARAEFINRYALESRLVVVEPRVWRQRKIEFLLQSGLLRKVGLRVCFSSGEGLCGTCEKCIGTAAMILAGGASFRDLGFPAKAIRALWSQSQSWERLPKEMPALMQHALCGRSLGGTRLQRIKGLKNLIKREFYRYGRS